MKKQVLLLVIILTVMVILAGCIVTKESPAPGCREYIGLPMAGGCFGKSAILNLKIEPPTECIKLEVNNCNGGVLEVRNLCTQTLNLGTVEIPPTERAALDVKSKNTDGYYTLVWSSSNFSKYIPDQDEQIKVAGSLGNQKFVVTYIKTKKLCE